MPVLRPNQPLEQQTPVLVVRNDLAAGIHRFALVVVNDRGVASDPDVISVRVSPAAGQHQPGAVEPGTGT
jgi:hypothetical protein